MYFLPPLPDPFLLHITTAPSETLRPERLSSVAQNSQFLGRPLGTETGSRFPQAGPSTCVY